MISILKEGLLVTAPKTSLCCKRSLPVHVGGSWSRNRAEVTVRTFSRTAIEWCIQCWRVCTSSQAHRISKRSPASTPVLTHNPSAHTTSTLTALSPIHHPQAKPFLFQDIPFIPVSMSNSLLESQCSRYATGICSSSICNDNEIKSAAIKGQDHITMDTQALCVRRLQKAPFSIVSPSPFFIDWEKNGAQMWPIWGQTLR